jgi:hypothetical protein
VPVHVVSAKFVVESVELPHEMKTASLPGEHWPLVPALTVPVWLLLLLQMSPTPEPFADTVSV